MLKVKCVKRIVSALILSALLVSALASCGMFGEKDKPNTGDYIKSNTITVSLIPCEGMTVTSDNPLLVNPGEDAVFSVELETGYTVFRVSDGAVYSQKDGTITLKNVRTPVTLKLNDDAEDGEVIIDGSLIAEPAKVTAEFESKLPTKAEDDTYMIIYYSNGGTAKIAEQRETTTKNDVKLNKFKNIGTGALVEYASDEYHVCPNALANKGYFTRPGYTLFGYNTKADNSGTYYGCGWNIVMPEGSKVIKLYAIWIKETPSSQFEITLGDNGGYDIKKYNGTDDTVVIPATLNGKAIDTISKDAFNASSVKTVFMGPSVKTIMSGAFNSCLSLTSVYLTDNLTIINQPGGLSFNNCPNFRTLNIQAVQDPAHTTEKHGMYVVKYEKLYTTKTNKTMIISGSNIAYGLDSEQLMSELKYKTTVINFGFHYQMPVSVMLQIAEKFAKAGDTVVLTPELVKQQFGSNTFEFGNFWELFESAYEAISYLDIRDFNNTDKNNLLTGFADKNSQKARRQGGGRLYEYGFDLVNQYGDFTEEHPFGANDPRWGMGRNYDYNEEKLLSEENVTYLNSMYDKIKAHGCKIYMSFAVVNINALSKQSQTEEYQNEWVEAIKSKLHVTAVISKASDYTLEPQYIITDSLQYHITTEGKAIRTTRLAADLNAVYAAGTK